MIRPLLLLSLLLLNGISYAQGQRNAAQQSISAAERAYQKHEYAAVLTHLDEAEKRDPKPSERILFLRIMSHRALLPNTNDPAFYNNMSQFDRLEALRSFCTDYLTLRSKPKNHPQGLHQVLAVQQSLKNYPVARVQFDEIKHLRNSNN